MPDIISILNSVANINDRRRQLDQGDRRLSQDDLRLEQAQRQFQEQIRQFQDLARRDRERLDLAARAQDLSEDRFEASEARADQAMDMNLLQLAAQGRIKRRESLAIDTPSVVAGPENEPVSLPGSSFEVAPPSGPAGYEAVSPIDRLRENFQALEGFDYGTDEEGNRITPLSPAQRLQTAAVLSGAQNPYIQSPSGGGQTSPLDLLMMQAVLQATGQNPGDPGAALQNFRDLNRPPERPTEPSPTERAARAAAQIQEIWSGIHQGQDVTSNIGMLQALQQDESFRQLVQSQVDSEDLQLWIGQTLGQIKEQELTPAQQMFQRAMRGESLIPSRDK